MLHQIISGFEGIFALSSEQQIRQTLKRLAGQRVALVLQPGNVWVIERAVDDNEETDAHLKTAYMRGWVEPLQNAIRKGRLTPDGALPPGELFDRVGPMWRLTDIGWAVINRSHRWTLFAILVSILSFAVSVGSLVISMKATHAR